MLKTRTNSILFVGIFFIVSCTKEQIPVVPDGEDMIYPLSVGNEWTSIRLFSIFNFRPFQPGVTPPRDTTIFARSFVTTIRTDTLHDSISTFVLLNTFYEGNRTFTSESYFNNKDDGLYFHAYKNPGYSIPKSSISRKIYFKGRYFSSVAEITSLITSIGLSDFTTSDTLIFEDPPLRSLPRFYRIGFQWIYRESNKPFRIDKTIVGKEVLQSHAGTYECYKVQWLIDLDNNGQWDEDIFFFDWVSTKGLVRRYALYKDLVWTIDSPEPLGKFDAKDEYSLIALRIP